VVHRQESIEQLRTELAYLRFRLAELEARVREDASTSEGMPATSAREPEPALRGLYENMLDGFAYHAIVQDSSGKPIDYIFLEVNPAFEELTGLARVSILGKRVTEVLPGIEHSEFDWIGTYGRVAVTGEPIAFEQRAEALDKWYQVRAYSPSPGHFATIFEDITQRKSAELDREKLLQSLTESERAARLHLEQVESNRRLLQSVLDNMVDGVYVCAPDGRIALVNEPGISLFGLSDRKEVLVPLADLAEKLRLRHSDGTPKRPDQLAASLALNGETVALVDEVFLDPRTGRDVFIRTSASPIQDEAGRVSGAVAVVRDITKLKELEREKEQFVAVAAHELKTPVAIMKGYAQTLVRKADDVPPERRRMVEAIERGADRIDRIVEELLDISRLHGGHLELQMERLDLSELLIQVSGGMSMTTSRHLLRVDAPSPLMVRGDRGRLEQVLVNLIDNAIRYSPAGGNVEIAARENGGGAVVSVTDHGVGIPMEQQPRVFERFYRAHTGTPYDYGGMGVALYISREIIQRHGGRMWFESREEDGSTFHFSLPLEGPDV
jgi:PAS domain S-box-containing protein